VETYILLLLVAKKADSWELVGLVYLNDVDTGNPALEDLERFLK
jgi:hypothetical protein